MNYPVKFYTSDMPNAPILNGHPGSFIALLDACLINGWGLVSVDSITYDATPDEATITVTAGHGFIKDQVILISGADQAEFNGEQRVIWVDTNSIKFTPVHTPSVSSASGSITAKVAPIGSWEKAFTSGDNLKAAYRSTSSKRKSSVYLRVDDSNSATTPNNWNWNGSNAMVEAYEDMTDIDTFSGLVNTGDNDRTFRKAYSDHTSYMDYVNQWQIIGDELFVYAFSNHSTQWKQNALNCMYFGEFISYKPDDPYPFVIQTHNQAAASSYTCSGVGKMDDALYRYLQRDHSGLNVGQIFTHRGLQIRSEFMGHNQLGNNPNPVDNGLHYTDKVYITEVGAGNANNHIIRGELPGLGYPLHEKPYNHGAIAELSWRGAIRKIFASWSAAGTNYGYSNDSSYGQKFFDIEGSWRP